MRAERERQRQRERENVLFLPLFHWLRERGHWEGRERERRGEGEGVRGIIGGGVRKTFQKPRPEWGQTWRERERGRGRGRGVRGHAGLNQKPPRRRWTKTRRGPDESGRQARPTDGRTDV